MTQRNGNGAMPVLALEMDRTGQVMKKMVRFDREGQLENTLVQALYPGLRVATIDIPQEPLDAFEQAQVAQSLAKLECDGVKYALVGASGSAKNGKYYAVEAPALVDRQRQDVLGARRARNPRGFPPAHVRVQLHARRARGQGLDRDGNQAARLGAGSEAEGGGRAARLRGTLSAARHL